MFLAIDFETLGLNVECPPIEVCAVLLDEDLKELWRVDEVLHCCEDEERPHRAAADIDDTIRVMRENVDIVRGLWVSRA